MAAGSTHAEVLLIQESGVPERRRPALDIVLLFGGPVGPICDAAAWAAFHPLRGGVPGGITRLRV